MSEARRLPRNVRLLMASRTVRSVGQGATVASFSLYLHALNYSGTTIGTILMAGLLFGALLTLIIGPLSDRCGSRVLLLGYEVAAAIAALAAVLSHVEAVLIVAATVAGFGRGANGAAGPFAPAEQAWLAREVDGAARQRTFTLNATLGFLGMAAGAALVALPAVIGRSFAVVGTYRLLFLLPLAGSLVSIALLASAHEPAAARPAAQPADNGPRTGANLNRVENRQLWRLALTNAVNGLAIGIVGPLMAYWFAQRFAQSPATIGQALAASFVLAAVGSMLSGRLALRFGAVRSMLWMRLIGVVLLIATPFAPVFILAAALYALRAAFNQGTTGTRQTVAASLTRAMRRGLGASVQNLSLQIPRAVGPVLGGAFIHAGYFITPFLLAAALQTLYLVLYWHFFNALDANMEVDHS
ncbi:major facilitator superfamily MFS_1 [Sulfuriferula multivorans]|uniref:Major facilitator superfamily MFS_1 n=1 Tax=Sulfuriferula multivorans TaxID=1559896 RepID=A0A401JD29_9PROT|nr:MFS transporter [Sulfuriferula multivorans]GBL45578.1 major facilitator superfamily MFS_1 [Sulfuriferula multivorans]